MKNMLKKILGNFEFRCIVGILACFAFLQYGQIRVENVILHQGETEEITSLPISRKMNQGEIFRVSFIISNPLNLHYDLNIIPDDCAELLTINGADIPLSDYSGRCNYSKGFVLADSVTAPHRVGPRTTYELTLKNGGGPGGINVFPKGDRLYGRPGNRDCNLCGISSCILMQTPQVAFIFTSLRRVRSVPAVRHVQCLALHTICK